MIDYIKYKILTDQSWRKQALKRLAQEQINQNIRVNNKEERIKGLGFDRQHKQDLLNCYFNNQPLDSRLTQKLSTFAQQIFKKLLRPNGIEKIYKNMNNDIDYLTRNNLKPQNLEDNTADITNKTKLVQLKKILNICSNDTKLHNNKTFYYQAVQILNKIYKNCDYKILSTTLQKHDFDDLSKITQILSKNNWNCGIQEVRESLQKDPNSSDYLPMFYKFNLFQFVKNVEQKYKQLELLDKAVKISKEIYKQNFSNLI